MLGRPGYGRTCSAMDHRTELFSGINEGGWGWKCACGAEQLPQWGVEKRSAESAAQQHRQDPSWPQRPAARGFDPTQWH